MLTTMRLPSGDQAAPAKLVTGAVLPATVDEVLDGKVAALEVVVAVAMIAVVLGGPDVEPASAVVSLTPAEVVPVPADVVAIWAGAVLVLSPPTSARVAVPARNDETKASVQGIDEALNTIVGLPPPAGKLSTVVSSPDPSTELTVGSGPTVARMAEPVGDQDRELSEPPS